MNVARTVNDADESLGQMVAINLTTSGSFGFSLQEKKKN
jgi:hypothetical protein